MSKTTTAESISTVEAEALEDIKPQSTTTKRRTDNRINLKTHDELENFRELYELDVEEGNFTGSHIDYINFLVSERQHNRASKPVASELTAKKSDDNVPKAWFTNLSGKTKDERETKLAEIKKTLGIPDNEDIIMTRAELYAKASELSKMSVDEIIQAGAESEAQALITALREGNEGAGKGRLGSADSALNTAFIELIEMIENGSYKPVGGLPITKIASRAGANFNSAKNWAKRNGHEFPMEIEDASRIAEQLKEHGY